MGSWSYPDLDAGGGPCEFCGEVVPPGGPTVENFSPGRRRRIYYHVTCRDAYRREHWRDPYDRMTLGEALVLEPWWCACMGAPNGAPRNTPCHCRLVQDQRGRLIRAAHIVVKLLADAAR